MTLRFKLLLLAIILSLTAANVANDAIIIDGRKIEIVRKGLDRALSGDLHAIDIKSGKELWQTSVTKPFLTGTTVGQPQRPAIVFIRQEAKEIVAYDDQARRYEIDPRSGKVK